MNVYEAVKGNVTARQAAQAYGFRVNKNRMRAARSMMTKTPA